MSQNVALSPIFGVSKTLKKMMKITDFDRLRGPLVDRDRAPGRVPKNHAKLRQKASKSDKNYIFLHSKNPKHTKRTHQNIVKLWPKSIQNHRNSSKSSKIITKTSTKFESAISNAPKPDQNVKNTKKSKRYINNDPKTTYFPKNPVLEPTKIARNRRFPLKIVKFAQ